MYHRHASNFREQTLSIHEHVGKAGKRINTMAKMIGDPK